MQNRFTFIKEGYKPASDEIVFDVSVYKAVTFYLLKNTTSSVVSVLRNPLDSSPKQISYLIASTKTVDCSFNSVVNETTFDMICRQFDGQTSVCRINLDSKIPIFDQKIQARLDEHDVEVVHLDTYASVVYKDSKTSSIIFTSPNLEKISIKEVAQFSTVWYDNKKCLFIVRH